MASDKLIPLFDPEPDDEPPELDDSTPIFGKNYASCVAICRLPEIVGGPIEWDELNQCPTLNRAPLTDSGINALREVISRRVRSTKGPLHVDKGQLFDAVFQVAHESPFLPQAEYLMALTWDHVPRLSLLSTEILHCSSEDTLAREYLSRWCVAAVARALEPGCQFDHVLVLIGPEGFYKSTFFKTLCMPWFAETTIDPKDDDSKLALSSSWVLELSELASVVNARDREAMLAFITTREDVWRRKYERMQTRIARHSVIVATGNRQHFLSSMDGARRFWTVSITQDIDVTRLKAWRDQIWAEAVHVHRTQGEAARWLSMPELRDAATADRLERWTESDSWEDVLGPWLVGRDEVSLREAFSALGIDAAQQTKAAQMRLASIMRARGYDRRVCRVDSRIVRTWVRVATHDI